jgi:hypothetical protein
MTKIVYSCEIYGTFLQNTFTVSYMRLISTMSDVRIPGIYPKTRVLSRDYLLNS